MSRASAITRISQGFLVMYLMMATYFTIAYSLGGDEGDRPHATMFLAGVILWCVVISIWTQVSKQEDQNG